MPIFAWTLTFQFLDWSIVKDNPGAEKDEVRYPLTRTILFGSYLIDFIIAFINPSFVLLIMLLSMIFLVAQLIIGKQTQA